MTVQRTERSVDGHDLDVVTVAALSWSARIDKGNGDAVVGGVDGGTVGKTDIKSIESVIGAVRRK